jgi:hypothetical protein
MRCEGAGFACTELVRGAEPCAVACAGWILHAYQAHEALVSMQNSVRVGCVAGPPRTRPGGRMHVQRRASVCASLRMQQQLVQQQVLLAWLLCFVVLCVCGACGCACGGERDGRGQARGLRAGCARRVSGRAHLRAAAVLRG